MSTQLHTAEQLREEVRLEREKLSSKEARLAGLEAALEATRREMDRQAAEVAAGMQVGRGLTCMHVLGLTGDCERLN
jgi:hypothetical protein